MVASQRAHKIGEASLVGADIVLRVVWFEISGSLSQVAILMYRVCSKLYSA